MIQFDPSSAALPWGAVRFLLQISISEVQVFGAMIDDVESIARMLAQYRIFEDVYLPGEHSEVEVRLEDALVRLYAEILQQLGRIIKFFSESTTSKFNIQSRSSERWLTVFSSTCEKSLSFGKP